MTPVELRIKQIIYNVCEGTGIDSREILVDNRKQEVVFARFILSKKLFDYGLSTPKIGRILNKNHASINYGLKQYENLLETCNMFRDMVLGVELMESVPTDLTLLK